MRNSITEKELTSQSENKSYMNFLRSIQTLKHANELPDTSVKQWHVSHEFHPIVSRSNQSSDNPKLYKKILTP